MAKMESLFEEYKKMRQKIQERSDFFDKLMESDYIYLVHGPPEKTIRCRLCEAHIASARGRDWYKDAANRHEYALDHFEVYHPDHWTMLHLQG